MGALNGWAYTFTDNKNPKGLWGQGVPPEFRDQDFELIKALSDVEQDIDMSQADMVAARVSLSLSFSRSRFSSRFLFCVRARACVYV